MTKRKRYLLSIMAVLMIAAAASLSAYGQVPQQESKPDKTRGQTYRLFNPTPAEDMRELSTDRPDQTESPYTVDADHFPLELEFVNATFDLFRTGGANLREHEWSVLPFDLKIGLLNSVDIQLVCDTYLATSVEDRLADTKDEESDMGDFRTQLNLNIWGNNGGSTALAVMPCAKWPLSESGLRNRKIVGGLIIPLGADLAMPGVWG